MNQIQSLEEQLIAQEWERLIVELRKASEIVQKALRRYEGEITSGDQSFAIPKALSEVASSAAYQSIDGGYRNSVGIASDGILPAKIPDALRPLLLSVASRELLESLRNVPARMDQVADMESREE